MRGIIVPIAGIYSQQDNYTEALKFVLKALKIWEEIGDKQGILNSYNRMGMRDIREDRKIHRSG